jgi:hypothetical protein
MTFKRDDYRGFCDSQCCTNLRRSGMDKNPYKDNVRVFQADCPDCGSSLVWAKMTKGERIYSGCRRNSPTKKEEEWK